MSLSGRVTGATLQVGVHDLVVSRRFYDELFGAAATEILENDLYGYEPHPGFWFEITKQDAPRPLPRFRFGVSNIQAARDDLVASGLAVTDVETVPGLVSWCDFDDPDGNPLGLYEDLA